MTAEAIPLLEGRGIGRRLPETDQEWLLRDVSLSVAAGSRVAIVGPTGSGKTLLLRALARLDPIDEGQVLWRGQSIYREAMPKFRQQCIYLHQRPALIEGSVEDNLKLPFEFQTHGRRSFERRRAVSFLARAEMTKDFLARSASDLSGGESQIVALIRALQLEPAMLLLDEPTAALDARSTRLIEQLLDDWFTESAETRAWIWVSHDAAQVRRVSDALISLAEGRMLPSSNH